MKKLLLPLTLLLGIVAQAQTTPQTAANQYVIKGRISGLTNEYVYLFYPSGDEYLTDSVRSDNGAFAFKGTIPHPALFSIALSPRSMRLPIFMQPGTVTIEANKDSIRKGRITGAPLDLLYKQHRRELDAQVGDKLQAVDRKYAAMKASPADKLPDTLAKQQSAEIRALFARADTLSQAFIKAHPNSVVSPFLAMSYYTMEPETDKLPALYAVLTPDVKKSYYGQQMKQLMSDLEKVGIGKTAPNFTLADTTGQSVSLSSVKGKYVLVDFWASWCGPCRKENPNVVAAYKKFHDKGFEIVGVSLDTKKNLWQKAINADGLNWYHLSDLKGWKSDILAQYVVKAVPTSYLLDKDGKIVAKNLRGEMLQRTLAQLLNER